jgi:hypothetical protein
MSACRGALQCLPKMYMAFSRYLAELTCALTPILPHSPTTRTCPILHCPAIYRQTAPYNPNTPRPANPLHRFTLRHDHPPAKPCTRVQANGRRIRPHRLHRRPTHPNTPPPSSAGLRTPRPPRCSTCVYRIVVATSECPSNSWIVRMSYPDSKSAVAKECRNV